jgi:hypothetical protein
MTAHQRRWAERRAQGLCGQCGVVPSAKFSRCNLCRGFINEWRKGWYHRPQVKSRELKKRAAYRSTHRDLLRARQRQWHRDNRDKALAGMREYYSRHREQWNEYKRKQTAA